MLIPEEFGRKTESYGEGDKREVPGTVYWKNENTGDYYSVPSLPKAYWAHPDEPLMPDFESATLVASKEAMNDPYLRNLGINLDPVKAGSLYNLKESNPSEFYSQIANTLSNSISSAWKMNFYSGNTVEAEQLLESIKEYDPKAYYSAKLTDLGQRIGWNYGENSLEAAKSWEEKLKQIIPDAQAAGFSYDQINSIISNNASSAGQQNQTRISDEKGNNFWNNNLAGALKIGAFALGAGGLDAALAGAAAGSGAGAGAGAIDSTAVALGGSGGGGAFVPSAGSGASFGIGAGAGAGVGSYVTPELMGPTYGELGITGVEGGFAGPTYAEMGYTGLNQGQAIAAADAASGGLSAKDVLVNLNRAKQLGSILSQTGNAAKGLSSKNVSNANQMAQQAGQNFLQPTPEQFGGLYQMNQNPFTFTNPLAAALKGKDATGLDVSGTSGQALNTQNQQANLLRMFG